MAANKVPGIRAALCMIKHPLEIAGEHNDSNVLTLGGRLLTQTQAEESCGSGWDEIRRWTPGAAVS